MWWYPMPGSRDPPTWQASPARARCPAGDPRFRFSVNFYGAPALSLQEFAYEQDLILGASLQVSAPLGQYDADKLVNIGTNRWSIGRSWASPRPSDR